jgi:hypothetical protein
MIVNKSAGRADAQTEGSGYAKEQTEAKEQPKKNK